MLLRAAYDSWTATRAPGRGLITACVVSTALVQPLKDLTGSHVFNPDWPPHAHFHDLAAIGMLEICSAASLYLLGTRRGDRRLDVAALMPAAFWAPFFPAHFVSGSSLDDTTAHYHDRTPPRIGRFTLYPNATLAAVQLGALAVGWARFRRHASGHS